MPKASLFIGSSTEGKSVAEAIQCELERDAETTLWTQGVFGTGSVSIEALEDAAKEFDFAILVFTADDPIISRGKEGSSPRDNVVFEFGLFVGRLGRKRTFLVYNRDQPPKLPSDLSGLTCETYGDRSDGNMRAAVGPACTKIKSRIAEAAFEDLPTTSKPNDRRIRKRPVTDNRKGSRDVVVTLYWAAPHRNIARNKRVADALRTRGIRVNVPYELVEQKSAREEMSPPLVRKICREAIRSSDAIAVDLDTYGLDTAWEIGFAESTKKPVFGLSQDFGVIVEARAITKRPFNSNFMHGWQEHLIATDSNQLLELCKGKVVYLAGSFSNAAGIAVVRESALKKVAKRLIIPADAVKLGAGFPAQYPHRSREQAINLLANSDVAIVLLPTYGMDTSWQIGFAEGRQLKVVGYNPEGVVGKEIIEHAPIWDHWMHGWKEKRTVTDVDQLVAVILGYSAVGLLTPEGERCDFPQRRTPPTSKAKKLSS